MGIDISNTVATGFSIKHPDYNETNQDKFYFWETIRKALEKSTYADIPNFFNEMSIDYPYPFDTMDNIGPLTIDWLTENREVLIYITNGSKTWSKHDYFSDTIIISPTDNEKSVLESCHSLINEKYTTGEIGLLVVAYAW